MDTASVTHRVTVDDTALALGSGDLEVLATPRVLAWLEEATCAALDLPTGQTSVGTRVELEHLAASPVRFQVAAQDAHGTLLASGEVRRVVVDRERFISRITPVGD
jgi:fluoroacetyl-CoA thioesterase